MDPDKYSQNCFFHPRPRVTQLPGRTVASVLRGLLGNPGELLLARWNWKSALLSSLFRGGIFFTVNLSAGWRAALGALLAEFGLRAATAGFYGSLTQSFRRVEPAWHAALAVMVMLPFVQHGMEFLLHWMRGTPKLLPSIAASASFTILSTLFNLYAMRRGALVVGDEGQSLAADFARIPRIVAGFLAAGPLALYRGMLCARRLLSTP